MRASASANASCQGQRAGRCGVQRRAVRVSRPGRASSRRRRVRAARTVWPGRPGTEVQRSRLWARQAMPVQAALAVNLPDGKCASALVFEIADAELDDGVLAVLGFDRRKRVGAVGRRRKQLPARQQLALAIERADAAHDQPPAAEDCLGDLRDARRRVVVKRRPCGLVDLLDRHVHLWLKADADRELPARPVEAVKRPV